MTHIKSWKTLIKDCHANKWKGKVAYLGGPMRGRQWYNFPAFDQATKVLQQLGLTVINPADLDRARGFDPSLLPVDYDWNCIPENFDLKRCILEDIEYLLKSDLLVILPKWKTSIGTQGEIGIAAWVGIPVYKLEKDKNEMVKNA